MPEGVAGFLDFVEKQEGQFELVRVVRGQRFLGDQRMSFPVPEVARGRADDFRNFVRVLELGAVDFDDGAGAAEENFGGGFDNARFAGASGPEEEQVADGAAGGVESSGKDLEQLDERLNAVVLADDFRAQSVLKFNGVRAADTRI